jgi:hypothetical protein
VFGDDAAARATVSAVVDEFGFEPVDGGPLSESWRSERDQPAYVKGFDKDQLTAALGQAKRDING